MIYAFLHLSAKQTEKKIFPFNLSQSTHHSVLENYPNDSFEFSRQKHRSQCLIFGAKIQVDEETK